MKTQYYRMPDGSIHVIQVHKSNLVLPSLLLEVDGEADLQTIPPRCEFCVVKDTCWRYSADENYDNRGRICDAYQPFW